MLKVFISHSSKDDWFVQRLAGDLQKAGVVVWADDMITVGDGFVGEINQGLFVSDYVVVVLSPNSIKSRWVEKEYSASLIREIREGKKNFVLPILIGNLADCDVPPMLSDKHRADFRRSYEAGLGALLRTLMPHAGFAPPSTVEAPQLVFEFELRKEWNDIQAMLEMIEQLAPECKRHVSALREAEAELEACVVEDNECRFNETARWNKATGTIARFVSSKYSNPYVAELVGKIGVGLASAFYCAGYRFYTGDHYREAQVLFDQALALDPWHTEAAQRRDEIAHILAKIDEELAIQFAEAKEAAYRGCYEDVVRIRNDIRNLDRYYRQSEFDKLLDVAKRRRGRMP